MTDQELISLKNAQLDAATSLLYRLADEIKPDSSLAEEINDWCLAVKCNHTPARKTEKFVMVIDTAPRSKKQKFFIAARDPTFNYPRYNITGEDRYEKECIERVVELNKHNEKQ